MGGDQAEYLSSVAGVSAEFAAACERSLGWGHGRGEKGGVLTRARG